MGEIDAIMINGNQTVTVLTAGCVPWVFNIPPRTFYFKRRGQIGGFPRLHHFESVLLQGV